MSGKDFSKAATTGRIYSAIQEATAEPAQEINKAQEAQEAQEKPAGRKPRRTYSEQEAAEIMQSLKTSGRKGLALPRINLAFAPDIYDFVKTMSRVRGETMTEFINFVLRQYMDDHGDIYERAIEFRNSL